jgi:hypothetical protein
MDTYKVQALDTMQKTIGALSEEVDKAQTYLDRIQSRDAGAPAALKGDLPAPADELTL